MFEPLPGERFMWKSKTSTKYSHGHAICLMSKTDRMGREVPTIKGKRLTDGRIMYVNISNAEKPPTLRSN
jgi:hypothetical protein